MKRCLRCGDDLPARARFCGKCGIPQSNRAGSSVGRRSVRPSGQSSRMIMLDNLQPISITAVKMNKQEKSIQSKMARFWVITSLLLCLIIGLGAYIASTYLFNPDSGVTPVASSDGNVQPSLSLQGPLSASVKQGQVVTLHGGHFRADDPISLLLDSTLPIKDKNNRVISVRASSAGDFNVSIPIRGPGWSVKPHYIEGVDKLTKQDAYLNILVSPAGVPETTSQNLALSMDGQTITTLTFHASVGNGNPNQQYITLTNVSGSPLNWTVAVNADHNLSWLVVDNNHLAGNLGIDGTDSIGVSALITALKSNQQGNPYTGQIVFTINGQEQLILSVELQVADLQSEIVFNPNPAVAVLGAGNTCQATTFTLINVGETFINWTLVPYDTDTSNHIQFIVNGQSITQGKLASSGVAGDTELLNLQCYGVSAGNSYKFTLYAGATSWPVTITIQA